MVQEDLVYSTCCVKEERVRELDPGDERRAVSARVPSAIKDKHNSKCKQHVLVPPVSLLFGSFVLYD